MIIDTTPPASPRSEALEPDAPLSSPQTPRRRRRLWIVTSIALAAAVVAIAATIVVLRINGAADDTDEDPVATATALAPVERRTVTAQQQVSGTLGFAGTYQAVGNLQGTVTEVIDVGATPKQGDVLYRVDGKPVILLDGTSPAWRAFDWGATGPDVRQLNAALVALGYADGLNLDPESDKVTWATQQAVENLQDAYGLEETGTLSLGHVVFLSGPLRITAVEATPGAPVGPGQTVLKATSTTPQVKVEIPVGLAQQIRPGDAVTVSLPDLSTAEGTVKSVGTVATPADSGSATLTVLIALTDPDVAVLDQAPVLVAITTATVEDALVVPVTALLALADGKYAVEVHGEDQNRLVEVQLGLFDNASGVVEVTGDGLQAGQQVVVPTT